MFPILGIIRVPGSWARRGRRLAAHAALVGLGLAIGVLLMEAALRLVPGLMLEHAINRARVYRDLAGVRTRPDPYIGFLYPPNFEGTMRHYDASFTFRTDSRGFRNAGPWPARADIVAVGDSLTFGFGVPDGQSWVDLASRSLEDATIVNLALPGFGPLQQLRVYETFGAALQPRVVLVGFFPANDFWDTAKFRAWLDLQEGGNYLLWRDFGVHTSGRRSMVEKILRSAYLSSFLWAVRNPETREFGRDAVVHDTREGPVLLRPNALRRLRQRASPGRPEFAEALRALQELDRRVHADGGRMLIVLLPSKESVYLAQTGGDEDPLADVYAALDRMELSYLDLTPLFRARAAAGERLFFEIDGHPNRRGYAVIADAVVEYLHAGGLADATPTGSSPR